MLFKVATAKDDRKISAPAQLQTIIKEDLKDDDKEKVGTIKEVPEFTDITMQDDFDYDINTFAKDSPLERRAALSLEKQLELEQPESHYDLKVTNHDHELSHVMMY